jgi:DtxR family Mn-dependent transcriptional regulator
MADKKKPEEVKISEIPESYQRYLDIIYNISKKKKGGWVTNKEIAENLQVEPASVSGMLDKLKNKKLINWEPRKSIRLTDKGKKYALQLEETHALLRTFFKEILKISNDELVEKISCDIEHHITQEVKESFRNFILKYHG